MAARRSPRTKSTPASPPSALREITDGLTKYPEDFHIHPKVQKLLEQRREMGYGKRPLDYRHGRGAGVWLARDQGVPIRFSGQDSRRGTFNQRHSVLIDISTRRNTFRCATWRRTRRESRSTIPSCPKPR